MNAFALPAVVSSSCWILSSVESSLVSVSSIFSPAVLRVSTSCGIPMLRFAMSLLVSLEVEESWSRNLLRSPLSTNSPTWSMSFWKLAMLFPSSRPLTLWAILSRNESCDGMMPSSQSLSASLDGSSSMFWTKFSEM